MRGAKPKSNILHLVNGNPSKRSRKGVEPKIPAVELEKIQPPAYLNKRSGDLWREYLPLLHQAGVATRVDLVHFGSWCTEVARYEKACVRIAKRGETIVGSRGTRIKNPWLRVAHDALEKMIKIGAEFGLMPLSRSRLRIEPPEKTDKDPANKYF